MGCSPDTSHREISADLPGKKRRGKRKNKTFFILFYFIYLSIYLFFFFFFIFVSKPLKFVLGLTKWEFSTGKKHFTLEKYIRKMTWPSEKYSSYALAVLHLLL